MGVGVGELTTEIITNFSLFWQLLSVDCNCRLKFRECTPTVTTGTKNAPNDGAASYKDGSWVANSKLLMADF